MPFHGVKLWDFMWNILFCVLLLLYRDWWLRLSGRNWVGNTLIFVFCHLHLFHMHSNKIFQQANSQKLYLHFFEILTEKFTDLSLLTLFLQHQLVLLSLLNSHFISLSRFDEFKQFQLIISCDSHLIFLYNISRTPCYFRYFLLPFCLYCLYSKISSLMCLIIKDTCDLLEL